MLVTGEKQNTRKSSHYKSDNHEMMKIIPPHLISTYAGPYAHARCPATCYKRLLWILCYLHFNGCCVKLRQGRSSPCLPIFFVTYQISKRCFHHRKMLSLSRFTSREILPITVVNPKANII